MVFFHGTWPTTRKFWDVLAETVVWRKIGHLQNVMTFREPVMETSRWKSSQSRVNDVESEFFVQRLESSQVNLHHGLESSRVSLHTDSCRVSTSSDEGLETGLGLDHLRSLVLRFS